MWSRLVILAVNLAIMYTCAQELCSWAALGHIFATVAVLTNAVCFLGTVTRSEAIVNACLSLLFCVLTLVNEVIQAVHFSLTGVPPYMKSNDKTLGVDDGDADGSPPAAARTTSAAWKMPTMPTRPTPPQAEAGSPGAAGMRRRCATTPTRQYMTNHG